MMASQELSHLIHQAKNDFWIGCETSSKLAPKGGKLGSTCSLQVRSITDNTSSCRLLGRIIVPHIVVRIQDTISTFSDSNVIDCISELRIVLGYSA
jgi:hypothetical protein